MVSLYYGALWAFFKTVKAAVPFVQALNLIFGMEADYFNPTQFRFRFLMQILSYKYLPWKVERKFIEKQKVDVNPKKFSPLTFLLI